MENKLPDRLGKNVLIMTPTLYFMGRVIGEDLMHIHLDHCSWIADTGRFHRIFRDGKPVKGEGGAGPTEVEPQPDDNVTSVCKNVSTIIDWPFPLWREPI